MKISEKVFEPEIIIRASRSGGPGGQNVNKVASKAELSFDIKNSNLLTEEQKEKIFAKLKNRISKEGILQISSQSSRTQFKNKKSVIKKFCELLENCFKNKKPRIPSKPSKKAKEKRIKEKKATSEKKERRRKL